MTTPPNNQVVDLDAAREARAGSVDLNKLPAPLGRSVEREAEAHQFVEGVVVNQPAHDKSKDT